MSAVFSPARPYRVALAIHAALVLVPSLLLIGFAIAVTLALTVMGIVMSGLEIGRTPLDWSLLRFAVLLVVLGACAFSGGRALSRLTRLIWTVVCARPIAAACILAGLIVAEGTGSAWRWPVAAYISGLPLLTLFGHLYWLVARRTPISPA